MLTVTRSTLVAAVGIALTPGWTSQADSVTGGVRVTFTKTGTEQSITAKIVPGKTEIES